MHRDMEGGPRTVAFMGAFVVLVVGALLLLDTAAEPAPSGDARPEAATTEEREAAPKPVSDPGEIVLPDHGHPLVWVRSGHKVAIHSAPGKDTVKTVGDETEFGSPTVFSVAEKKGEWAGVPNPYTGNGTLGWIRLDGRDLKSGFTSNEIVVDLSDHKAQLVRDGKAVRSFTVSIGAEGTTTPTGRFAVTDTFRGDLNPAYGCCAVALTAQQPNLDSGWVGGDRIAIHGTAGPLGVNISHGCIRAADSEVSALVDQVPPGTPVTVRA